MSKPPPDAGQQNGLSRPPMTSKKGSCSRKRMSPPARLGQTARILSGSLTPVRGLEQPTVTSTAIGADHGRRRPRRFHGVTDRRRSGTAFCQIDAVVARQFPAISIRHWSKPTGAAYAVVDMLIQPNDCTGSVEVRDAGFQVAFYVMPRWNALILKTHVPDLRGHECRVRQHPARRPGNTGPGGRTSRKSRRTSQAASGLSVVRSKTAMFQDDRADGQAGGDVRRSPTGQMTRGAVLVAAGRHRRACPPPPPPFPPATYLASS